MSKKEKKLIWRILISGAIFLAVLPLHYREFAVDALGLTFLRADVFGAVELPVFLAAYALIGWDVVYKALRNVARGQVLDENFLMTAATVGAFFLQEYPEGVAVMLFYQVGECFQSYAVGKSRRSISELMDIRPDYANLLRDGGLTKVDPEEVLVGDIIVVKPGERIPLDGAVTQGNSTLDTSALTGESVPREVEAGQEVISGCINQTGKLTIRVDKEYGQSTVAKILELVENSSDKKSRSEAFITRFARYYTPFVVIAAVCLAVLPPIISAQPFRVWVERALTFLVISCPCALVISVPLSFFGGIGGASKSGALVKGSNYLEALAGAEIVVFDKTGTLTKGNFAVSGIYPVNMRQDELLRLAAYAEDYSSHPIAVSIKQAYGKPIQACAVTDIEEIAGCGVKAVVEGSEVLAGNIKLMKRMGIRGADAAGTAVHIAINGDYAGYILIEDEVKQDAREAIRGLRAAGIQKTVMLTGDMDEVGKRVAAALRLDMVYTELLPAGKVEIVEELMLKKSAKGKLVFVGDGINDAPVLARADIGIAMGGLGSDAAIEAAYVVIMTDEPSKIVTVIKIARKTLAIVHQNIVFALGVKAIVLILGATGFASMWGAVFADVGVSVIAILNALRALNISHGRIDPLRDSSSEKSRLPCGA